MSTQSIASAAPLPLYRFPITVSCGSTQRCQTVVVDLAVTVSNGQPSESFVLFDTEVYYFGDGIGGRRFYRDVLRRTQQGGGAVWKARNSCLTPRYTLGSWCLPPNTRNTA